MIYWLKLPNATITTVYIVFVATTASSISATHTGAEPNYSATYGQYDTGASVFNNYWNFAGTTLPSTLTTLANGGTATVDNGITIAGASSSDSIAIISTTAYTYPQIVESYISSWTAGRVSLEESTANTQASAGYYISSGYMWLYVDSSTPFYALFSVNAGGATGQVSTAYDSSFTTGIMGNAWSATGAEAGYINYATEGTATDTSLTIGNYYVSLGNMGSATTPSFVATWLRTRTYPSGGTMPTLTYGSVTATLLPISFIYKPFTTLKQNIRHISLNYYFIGLQQSFSTTGSIGIQTKSTVISNESYSASVNIKTIASMLSSSNYKAEINIQTKATETTSSKYKAEANIKTLASIINNTKYTSASIGIKTSATTVTGLKYKAEINIQTKATETASSNYKAEANIKTIASLINNTKYTLASIGIKTSAVVISELLYKANVSISTKATEIASSKYKAEANIKTIATLTNTTSYTQAKSNIKTTGKVTNTNLTTGTASIKTSAYTTSGEHYLANVNVKTTATIIASSLISGSISIATSAVCKITDAVNALIGISTIATITANNKVSGEVSIGTSPMYGPPVVVSIPPFIGIQWKSQNMST